MKRKNIIASFDADVVALMKKAGGIMLAITNVSELCMVQYRHSYVLVTFDFLKISFIFPSGGSQTIMSTADLAILMI